MSLRRLIVLIVLGCAAGLAAVAALGPERDPRYPAGACTAWAYERRPDLTRGTRGLAAGDWEAWARAHGYRVDTRPQVGDVAVWSRNVGAGPDGHVAYVETVTPDGAVFVSERNVGGCVDVAFVRLTPSRLSAALFIHPR